MNFALDKDVQFILKKLNEYGSGYIVGGAIRDIILGIAPDDYDFATDIDYEKLKKIFKDNAPRDTGANFGILTIKVNGKDYEIAKFRKEMGVFNNRYPKKIEFVSSLREDLKRRDFTINSLGYNEKDGLIDIYDGVSHINRKIIKFIGQPKMRIEEDALRIMRAFRFMSKFGFSLDKKTAEGIYEKRKLLNKISKERIFDELCKILMAPNVKKALNEMKKLGVLEIIIPEYKYIGEINKIEKKNIFKEMINIMEKSEENLFIRLSILFYQIGKVNSKMIDSKGNITFEYYERESSYIVEERLKNLKVSNKIINSVKKIVFYHQLHKKEFPNKIIKKIILDLGNDLFSKLLYFIDIISVKKGTRDRREIDKFFQKINKIYLKGKIPSIKDIEISGVDLINLGFDIKDINKIKEEIHDLVLEDFLKNDKESIIKYLIKNYNIDFSFNYEKSCGAVIYNLEMKKYLIVKTKNGNWGFPKGHMETGEKEEETAIREVKEETNLDIELVEGIREEIKYIPKEDMFKSVVLFLGICNREYEIKLEEEEIEEYMWSSYEEATKVITYKVQRDVLDKINGYLKGGKYEIC